MQKQKGFSLIELLIVTGIVALLAMIALPNFSRMRGNVNFKTEVDTVFDQLLEVRMNALTGKMCNEKSGVKWIFLFDANSSDVSCTNADETVLVRSYETAWHESYTIEIDGVPKTSVQIEFLADTAQSLIPDGANQGTDAEIVLTSLANEQQTICFNRIAGIPNSFSESVDCLNLP